MADIQPSSLSGLSQPEFIRQETPKVVIGGVCTGIAGMTIGSLLAVQKNQPATLPALSISETIHCQSDPPYQSIPSTSSTSNRHFHGLLPTGISAAIIGGSVNGYLRGRHVVGRSSMTTSLVCCTLQVIYNEIGILSRALSDRELRKTRSEPSLISDKEWKERILVQLSQSDLQLKTLNRQINQLQECISTRHLNKPQSSN
ncbi:hypothetical protein PSTT_10530, partial [Puccinia striiformis]